MAITKFVPDESQPFGTGMFYNDTGRSLYTFDPDTARSLPPTPPPPGTDDAETAPPGTRVSYAGDASSPYANAVASNEGATGSAALGAPPGATGVAHDVVAKAAQVVPPMGPPPPPAAAPGATVSPAESAVAKAASVVPPISRTSTTVVQGRKDANVEKQIGTDRAALEGFAGANEANAISGDARAVAGVDKRIESRQSQQTQAKEDAAQYADDQRSADERVKQLMDLPDGQLDPDRFVNSLSTGSKIGLTVLAAISGFANGMRNPNGPTDTSVLNVLTRRIDEDIASQKDSLAQGRLRKSNLIARAEAQGASSKQAEATARAQLWSLAADIGDLQAQRIGLDGAQLAAAKQQTDAMRYQAGVHEGDLRAQTESHIQSTTERERLKPTGEAMDPLKLIQLQNALLDQQDAAEVSKIVGKNLSPERVKELKATVKEVGSGVSETDGAIDMTKNLVESLGGKIDTTTGAIAWPKDLSGAGFWGTLGQSGVAGYSPPGLAVKAAKGAGLVRTDYDRAVAAQNALKEYVTKNLTGANSNARQDATFTQMTGANLANEDEVKENVQNWANTVFAMRNGQLSRLGEEGQALLSHNAGRAKQGSGAPPLVER